jgi:hypothetical protein
MIMCFFKNKKSHTLTTTRIFSRLGLFFGGIRLLGACNVPCHLYAIRSKMYYWRIDIYCMHICPCIILIGSTKVIPLDSFHENAFSDMFSYNILGSFLDKNSMVRNINERPCKSVNVICMQRRGTEGE